MSLNPYGDDEPRQGMNPHADDYGAPADDRGRRIDPGPGQWDTEPYDPMTHRPAPPNWGKRILATVPHLFFLVVVILMWNFGRQLSGGFGAVGGTTGFGGFMTLWSLILLFMAAKALYSIVRTLMGKKVSDH